MLEHVWQFAFFSFSVACCLVCYQEWEKLENCQEEQNNNYVYGALALVFSHTSTLPMQTQCCYEQAFAFVALYATDVVSTISSFFPSLAARHSNAQIQGKRWRALLFAKLAATHVRMSFTMHAS